jgi:hypothetical protein
MRTEAESFKARLRGTADMVSRQTHLIGTIVDGPTTVRVNWPRGVETQDASISYDQA